MPQAQLLLAGLYSWTWQFHFSCADPCLLFLLVLPTSSAVKEYDMLKLQYAIPLIPHISLPVLTLLHPAILPFAVGKMLKSKLQSAGWRSIAVLVRNCP